MSSTALAAVQQQQQNVVKVLVLPVLRRAWLFHAWREATPSRHDSTGHDTPHLGSGTISGSSSSSSSSNAASSAASSGSGSSSGASSSGASTSGSVSSWSDMLQGLRHRFDNTVAHQWREVQTAKEGSFRSYLHKLALLVLSREDPVESFLKAVPNNTTQLQIIYPSSLCERLVRRRLRQLAMTRVQEHRRKMLAWGLATLPQLPLLVTPLPNITVYYSVYRYLSHVQAMGGAGALRSTFELSDALQLITQYRSRRLALLQQPDRKFGVWTWRNNRKVKMLEREEKKCTQLVTKHQASGKAPYLAFEASDFLEHETAPTDRWSTPLSDEAVQRIAQHYGLPDLREHANRARNRAMRGMPGSPSQQTYYKLTRDHVVQARDRRRSNSRNSSSNSGNNHGNSGSNGGGSGGVGKGSGGSGGGTAAVGGRGEQGMAHHG